MTEETPAPAVTNPDGLLIAYNNLKEEVRKISAERDELTKRTEKLVKAAQDNEWRQRALLAETKAALNSQGIKDADRLMRYVGTEGIDFDDEGKLTGLDDRLSQLKKDLPEVFDAKRRAGGKADIFANDPAKPEQDPIRQMVHASLNG